MSPEDSVARWMDIVCRLGLYDYFYPYLMFSVNVFGFNLRFDCNLCHDLDLPLTWIVIDIFGFLGNKSSYFSEYKGMSKSFSTNGTHLLKK